MREDNLTNGDSPAPEELSPSEYVIGYGSVEQMQRWLAEAEAQHDYERAYCVCTNLFLLSAFPEVPLSNVDSLVDLLGEIECIKGNTERASVLAEIYIDAKIIVSKLIKHGIMVSYFSMASFHIPGWLGWLVFHR